MFGNLLTRARSWRDIEPWYPDQTRGIPKTSESRAIESVMNALVIVRRDAPTGHLSDDARTALGVMWALQMKTGPNSGGWTWLNFNYEPWESPNSPYFGASLAALAVGSAPDTYAASPEIQENVKALRGYFNREHSKVALLNQLMGIWAASGIMRDLLTDQQRQSTIDAAFALQQPDGGWSTSSLGSYKRVDNTPNDTRTDGYGTALATLALQAAGVPANDSHVVKGLDWLRGNQDRATGRWVAASLNKRRPGIGAQQVHERRGHGLRGTRADLPAVTQVRVLAKLCAHDIPSASRLVGEKQHGHKASKPLPTACFRPGVRMKEGPSSLAPGKRTDRSRPRRSGSSGWIRNRWRRAVRDNSNF